MTEFNPVLLTPRQALLALCAVEESILQIKAIKRRNARINRMEVRAARRFRKVFRKISKDILGQLRDCQVAPSNDSDRKRILTPFEDYKKDFLNAIGDAAEEAAIYGSRRTVSSFRRRPAGKRAKPTPSPGIPGQPSAQPVTIPNDYTYGEPSERVIDVIRTGAIDSGTMSYARYEEEILESLEESYSEGKGIWETVQDLQEVLDSMEYYEMERIARTTINGAQNRGAYESLRDNDIQYQQWWTADDDRVRGLDPKDTANHVEMHGQIVEVGRPFSNGLYYPGDQSGPIEEWINCRCILLPYLMPEDMMAPAGMDYFFESDLVPIAAAAG